MRFYCDVVIHSQFMVGSSFCASANPFLKPKY